MLTDVERELITAAVDGELTPDREAVFRRLLAESTAALALYDTLCLDRDCLRQLPRVPAPKALVTGVMSRVRQTPPTVAPARPAPHPRQPVWLPVSLAASLFLCVGGASFLFFRSQAAADRIVAQGDALPSDATAPLPIVASPSVARSEPLPHHREVSPAPRPAKEERIASDQVRPSEPKHETVPPNGPVPGDVLASPIASELPAFQAVQIRLPVLLPVGDLATEDAARRISAELGREPAYRIDVFTNDPHATAEALVAAGKAVNLSIAVDAVAHERLRLKLPFSWAVAVDSLTPTEVAAWLAATNRHASSTASPGRSTGTVHIVPAGTVEQKEWKELVGTEAPWAKANRAETTIGPRSVSAGTADQVTSSLQRSGSAGKHQHGGLLVTYLPREGRVNAALSKEIKQFGERRGDRKPGSVSLLVVIRSSNG